MCVYENVSACECGAYVHWRVHMGFTQVIRSLQDRVAECLWVLMCENVCACVVHMGTGMCIFSLPKSSGVCRTEW